MDTTGVFMCSFPTTSVALDYKALTAMGMRPVKTPDLDENNPEKNITIWGVKGDSGGISCSI